MKATRWIAAAGISALTASVTPAQDTTHTRAPWLTGMAVGVPGARNEAYALLFTVGATFTQLRKSKVGPDFSIGVMPYALRYGTLALGMRGGLALPLQAAPGVLLIPSGGMSLAAAMIPGVGGAAIPGLNAGFALVLLGANPKSSGFRAGITWHKLSPEEEMFWLLEIGAVQMSR